jgi:hypothetical protein
VTASSTAGTTGTWAEPAEGRAGRGASASVPVGGSCQPAGMRLTLLGELRDLLATDLDMITSRHTGRPLRQVELDFRCGDALVSDLTKQLEAAREDAPLEDEGGTLWIVKNHSRSNVNGGAWRVSVTLAEVEALEAERLEFAGLSLPPSFYNERASTSDDVLVITAELAPGPDEEALLEQLITEDKLAQSGDEVTYFPLRRVGISDEPISVRFGRCLWQATANGARRHLVVFVSQQGDTAETRRRVGLFANEPRSSNAARIAMQGREVAQAILDELDLAGVLSPEALERVRARGAEAWDRRFRDLAEVDDLTDFR